ASPALRLLALWLEPSNPNIQYILLPCRLDGLALGAMIAIRLQKPLTIDQRLLGAITLATVGAAYLLYVTLGHNRWSDPFTRVIGYSLFPAAFACIVLYTIQFRGSRSIQWLNVAPLQFIGKISYAVYLLQVPVAIALGAWLESTDIWRSEVTRFVL